LPSYTGACVNNSIYDVCEDSVLATSDCWCGSDILVGNSGACVDDTQ